MSITKKTNNKGSKGLVGWLGEISYNTMGIKAKLTMYDNCLFSQSTDVIK